MKHYYFTSESVSAGHPDKVADQISDAIVDAYLAQDESSKVACEVLVTTGQVIIAGEVKSSGVVDVQKVARDVIRRIGYTKSEYKFDSESCGVLNAMHEQSQDIRRGVDKDKKEQQGAGDQGMMFGYATNETKDYMPLPLYLAHKILIELNRVRVEGNEMGYLRPDAKSQVTVEYDENGKPFHIDTIVVSTQHDEFYGRLCGESQEDVDRYMREQIQYDIENVVLRRVMTNIGDEEIASLYDEDTKVLVNPTGKFVIGGPHGDTGLTGRKIIVDTYGGKGAHGGGAFSGKDPSKVDRSAAYAARYIAKNMVAAGVADEMLVQLAYAIGVAEPVSVFVNTNGTCHYKETDAELAELIKAVFDLTPYGIINGLGLRKPIYEETASYGHMGRECVEIRKVVNGEYVDVTLFPWERLDKVELIQSLLK